MMSPNHHRTIGVTCHGTVDWQVGGPKHCWWLGRWFSTHPPTEKQFQKWFQGDIDDITSEPPKNHRCDLPKPFWWVGGWLFHPPTHRKKNFESGSEVTLMMSLQNHQRTTGVTSHNPFGGWVGGFPTHPPKKNFESGSEVTPEPPKNHCDSKILIYQLTNWRTGTTVGGGLRVIVLNPKFKFVKFFQGFFLENSHLIDIFKDYSLVKAGSFNKNKPCQCSLFTNEKVFRCSLLFIL